MADIDEMPSSEFHEWMTYEKIEPFGDRRGDLHAAMVMSTIGNTFRSSQSQPITVTECLPKWDEAAKPAGQTAEEQIATMDFLRALQEAKQNG